MFSNFKKRITKNDVDSETNNNTRSDKSSDRYALIKDSLNWEVPEATNHSPRYSAKEINTKQSNDETPQLKDESIDNESTFFEELIDSIEGIEKQCTLTKDSSDWRIPQTRVYSKFINLKRSKDETPQSRNERIAYKSLLIKLLKSLKYGLEDIRRQRAANDRAKKANSLSKLGSNLLRFESGNDNNIVPKGKSLPEGKPLLPIDPPTSAKKSSEKISKNPFKVLDAQKLQDDFYFNLVDWSSTNIVGVGLDSCVHLYNPCTSEVTLLCDVSSIDNGYYARATSVSWSESGRYLAVGIGGGLVQVWDVTANKCVKTLKGHVGRVDSLAWNGDILLSGSRYGSILQRDIRTPCIVPERKLKVHRGDVCGLKWSPDGQSIASGGNDKKLLLWNMHSSKPYQTYHEHTAAVKAIAWSPHQRGLLASGGGMGDGNIRLWDTLTGQPIDMVETGSQVCNLAWSKHTSELVSTHGCSNHYAACFVDSMLAHYGDFYSAYSMRSIGNSRPDMYPHVFAEIYPDDSPQNQISVWKYPSLDQVAELTGHTKRVLYMATSPDSDSIVTGGADETLRFWDVFTETRQSNASKLSTNCCKLQ